MVLRDDDSLASANSPDDLPCRCAQIKQVEYWFQWEFQATLIIVGRLCALRRIWPKAKALRSEGVRGAGDATTYD
jgi:hypothetical protein